MVLTIQSTINSTYQQDSTQKSYQRWLLLLDITVASLKLAHVRSTQVELLCWEISVSVLHLPSRLHLTGMDPERDRVFSMQLLIHLLDKKLVRVWLNFWWFSSNFLKDLKWKRKNKSKKINLLRKKLKKRKRMKIFRTFWTLTETFSKFFQNKNNFYSNWWMMKKWWIKEKMVKTLINQLSLTQILKKGVTIQIRN